MTIKEIGKHITCKNCGNTFVKKTKAHKFCKIKCKDRYHNKTNPRGYYASNDNIDEGQKGWNGHK